MKGCANCNGTFDMISLNDNGETYTIHLPEKDGNHREVEVDFETLKKLQSAISIQMLMAREFKYVFDGDSH